MNLKKKKSERTTFIKSSIAYIAQAIKNIGSVFEIAMYSCNTSYIIGRNAAYSGRNTNRIKIEEKRFKEKLRMRAGGNPT